MSDTMRGSRLGTTSYETDKGPMAARSLTTYVCDQGHQVTLPFSAEATEIPSTWPCACGALALLIGAKKPELAPAKHVRTQWDMLLERRTVKDLESILRERLEEIRHPRKSA